jgi:hypothetical protein
VGNASNLKRRTDDAGADPGYVGRADLLDRAVATCLELRRELGEFDLLPHDEAEGIRGRLMLDRCDRLRFDLAAMWQAMDSDMRLSLSEAIERLPSPADLAHRT